MQMVNKINAFIYLIQDSVDARSVLTQARIIPRENFPEFYQIDIK